MVSNTEVFTENSPMSPSQYVAVRNTSAIKPLRQFLDTLEIKPKTYVRRFCASKSKYKAIRDVGMLWSSIPKRWGHLKINQQVKKYLYNWVLQHHQVVQYPIANYCLKYLLTIKCDHS